MGLWHCVLFCLNFYFGFGTAKLTVSEEDYVLLPKVYHFNDTEKCLDKDLFCKLDVRLEPRDKINPPRIWTIIEQVNNGEDRFYRRDMVYRGLCSYKNAFKDVQNEYKKYGLVGYVDKSYCTSNTQFSDFLGSTDILIWMAITCYIIFVIYCTLKTFNSNGTKENSSQYVNRYVKIFSVINTWKEIRKPNKNEDFNNLRSIQGMRTVGMAMIVSAHSFVGMLLMFSHNPQYVENLYLHPLKQMFISSFGLLVQIFFIISAWLLAVQLHNNKRKYGAITAKDVLILALNRYFRLMPAVLLVLCLHGSTSVRLLAQPIYRSQVESELNRCKIGWWRSLFFIQNIGSFAANICSPGTWYIAADTQMYLMTTICFYLSQKFKISMKYFLGAGVALALCIQGYTVMTTDFDGILRFFPRLLPGETSFNRPEFIYSYSSTICNIATYVIGFTFGTIYCKNKKKIIFDTPMKNIAFYAAFLGIPFMTFLIYPYRSSREIEVLMAVSLRPIFSLGIAIGLLGMATKAGGFIKKFLEWEPLVFLGSCTYSVYMFHFALVFGRMMSKSTMTNLDDSYFFTNLILDIAWSFLYGLLMYIILEHPFGQIQKMLLPQIKKNKETTLFKDS